MKCANEFYVAMCMENDFHVNSTFKTMCTYNNMYKKHEQVKLAFDM